MRCYRTGTAHDKSRRRARRCRRALVGRSPALGAGGPVDTGTGHQVWCLVGGKAPSKRAVDVSLLNRAGPGPPHRRPLTVDRGHEFAPGPALEEPLGTPVYFCKARCPWQRGTNENTNGLLREYFPKRTPLDGISPTRIQ